MPAKFRTAKISPKSYETIERWMRLANLLPPSAELPAPEVVRTRWHPAPKSEFMRRVLSRQSQPRRSDPLTDSLKNLWQAWQREFGKPAGENPLYLQATPKGISKTQFMGALAALQRAASISIEVSFLAKRGRGRPRKGEQVGLIPQRRDWKPRDEMELYRLFYMVRTTLQSILTPTPDSIDALDIPIWTTIFMTPSGVAVSRGPSEEFLKDLLSVEFSRIRKCPICFEFYYAWRRDLEACSPRHRNNWNVQKFRSPEKKQQYTESRWAKFGIYAFASKLETIEPLSLPTDRNEGSRQRERTIRRASNTRTEKTK